MYKSHVIGIEGENIAANFLERKEYKIIERNFKCKSGEIDIIAFDTEKEELVFFEVKTRTNKTYGNPAEAVGVKKQKHIYRTAKYYTHIHNLQKNYIRIDVIEVYLTKNTYKVNHLKQVI